MSEIRGLTIYKHFAAQQVDHVWDTFRTFLSEVRPARILEIGTAQGGFTHFLREHLDLIGLHHSTIMSLDIYYHDWYEIIRAAGVDIRTENIFSHSYMQLAKPEVVVPFIQSEGTTVVLCDGGCKICEFNLLAPYLKVGDFIMAHDYCDTQENFEQNYLGKIWNWCEIKDSDIQKTCEENGLTPFMKTEFDNVVWVCRQRTSSLKDL